MNEKKQERNSIGLNRLILQKGVTLIALVITIIILLILAGIVLQLTLGQDGVINKAQYAEKQYENAEKSESKDINDLYSQMLVATNDSSKITISVEELNELINNKVEENMTAENEVLTTDKFWKTKTNYLTNNDITITKTGKIIQFMLTTNARCTSFTIYIDDIRCFKG